MRRAVLTLLMCACTPSGSGDEATADAAPDGAAVTPDASPGTDGPPSDEAPPDGMPLDAAADAAPADAAPPDAGPPPTVGDTPRFAFPVAPTDRRWIHPGLFFGVDHDPAAGDPIVCTDYDGRHFPFCYDEHHGSDFPLDGGFTRMDAGSAVVIAAAGGTVVRADDGNYDRCHGNTQDFAVSCDGNPMVPNRVDIAHANGWQSRYYHLMQGSVSVRVGDVVGCGTPIGLVGSSGRSFAPHLHFEVRDPGGAVADPFAGRVNGPISMWTEQRADDGLPGPACDSRWGPARP
ncbi:MAG: M23 family metallopeptidase [Myxococcales bacterium]|nr:M23 family metallopeptidase [Myxococcales bacterium]